MSFLLLAVAAAAVTYVVGKAWAIAIPLVVGGLVAIAIAAVGGSLSDTPIPVTIAIATVAAALGLLVRRQRAYLNSA